MFTFLYFTRIIQKYIRKHYKNMFNVYEIDNKILSLQCEMHTDNDKNYVIYYYILLFIIYIFLITFSIT